MPLARTKASFECPENYLLGWSDSIVLIFLDFSRIAARVESILHQRVLTCFELQRMGGEGPSPARLRSHWPGPGRCCRAGHR